MTDQAQQQAAVEQVDWDAAEDPVFAYLLGEGPLEGFWFGEPMDQDARPSFWWREHLRRALADTSGDGGEGGQDGQG